MKFHNFFEMQKFVNNTLLQNKSIDKLVYNNITKYSDLKIINKIGKIPFSNLDLTFLEKIEKTESYYFEFDEQIKLYKTKTYEHSKNNKFHNESFINDTILISILDIDLSALEYAKNYYYNSELETFDWKSIFQVEVVFILKFIQFLLKLEVEANICFSVKDKEPIIRINEIA